jgi:serine beta-lactamase-like protein LACTB, mitochondrial
VHYANGKVIPTLKKYTESNPFADPINSLDKFNQSKLVSKPGEKYNYSSYAYILLSAAIQRAGKKPFNEQLEQRIVKPLDLTSFQFDVPRQKRNWAMGYVKLGPSPVRTTDVAHYWKHGAGGFKSNVNDFSRWAQALINRELVSEETEKKMWEPQKLSNGKLSTPIRSLGFVLGDGKRQKVFHEGKQNETRTRLVIYPGEKHGLVVMCNCDYAAMEPITKAIYEALGDYGKHEKDDG